MYLQFINLLGDSIFAPNFGSYSGLIVYFTCSTSVIPTAITEAEVYCKVLRKFIQGFVRYRLFCVRSQLII